MRSLKYVLLVFSIASSLLCFSQTPEWIDFDKRSFLYPKEDYYTGYYSAPFIKNQPEYDQFQTLLGYAKSDIVENMVVSINSVSNVETNQKGRDFTQSFSQKSVAMAKAELAGLKTATWKDPKKKELHAIAYISKRDLVNFYRAKLSESFKSIEANLKEADQYRQEGKNELALNRYYQCQQQIQEAGEANTILLAVQKQRSELNFDELNSRARAGIETITGAKPQNADDAALFLVEAYKKQLKDASSKIRLFAFSYQDSRMSGPFAAYFQKRLESKLTYRNFIIDAGSKDENAFLLTGTYWKESGFIRIVTNLIDPKEGSVKASAEATIPENWFSQNNVAYLPENFEESFTRMKAFTKDEIVSGGLHLDAWTNKGDQNLLFHENDTLKLYIRANHECYLRFVYYMADGSKVLLMDDYYISSDKVNQVIQIPEDFICAGPFGTESLVLNGQTTPFSKLNTEVVDGYTFIKEDVNTIVAQSRGFKKASSASLKGEKRLTITTLAK